MRFFLATTILCLLVACKQTSRSQNTNQVERREYIVDFDLDKIKERGYITALMDNSSTGLFVYRGKTMGYEYELLKRFCEEHNLELRIKIIPSIAEAFDMLNVGEGDILAYNLTVTKERKKEIAFTHYHSLQRQVLIQRKPDNWREMKAHEIEAGVIRNPIDLIGKEVMVRPHSSYHNRLHNLSDEIGGDILTIPSDKSIETEELIKWVSEGKIDYTVAEENIALVNATYYRNIDIKTPISFPTQIAWGIRKNASGLQGALNEWIEAMRRRVDYYVIYDKYFKSSKSALIRSRSEYSSIGGGAISEYDTLFKVAAQEMEWDWLLLAAQAYKESKFDKDIESWAGAIGLMQVLPSTGMEHDISKQELFDPDKNMHAATRHLMWLKRQWRHIENGTEQQKFILASYNVGLGHVQDAVRLTKKYGGDIDSWEEVSEYLLKKSSSDYYTDPVVEYGYCRGAEPVSYVKSIFDSYTNYKEILQSEKLSS